MSNGRNSGIKNHKRFTSSLPGETNNDQGVLNQMELFFNAMHAPIGAHASFTLGCRGKNGGLGLELGGPADENIYIGVETLQRCRAHQRY